MSDLAERLSALSERNSLPLTYELNEAEKKERYLEMLAEGFSSPEIAKTMKETGSWFRKFRSKKSPSYDPEFSLRYEEIMGGEHQEALADLALAAMIQAANNGNVRAAEKILMAYHSDFQFLRPAAFAGDTYNVDKLIQIMPGIPTHLLEQMREELLKQKELPVIDA